MTFYHTTLAERRMVQTVPLDLAKPSIVFASHILNATAAENMHLSEQVSALREEAAADEAEALRDDVALLRTEVIRLSDEVKRLQGAPRVSPYCPPCPCQLAT